MTRDSWRPSGQDHTFFRLVELGLRAKSKANRTRPAVGSDSASPQKGSSPFTEMCSLQGSDPESSTHGDSDSFLFRPTGSEVKAAPKWTFRGKPCGARALPAEPDSVRVRDGESGGVWKSQRGDVRHVLLKLMFGGLLSFPWKTH